MEKHDTQLVLRKWSPHLLYLPGEDFVAKQIVQSKLQKCEGDCVVWRMCEYVGAFWVSNTKHADRFSRRSGQHPPTGHVDAPWNTGPEQHERGMVAVFLDARSEVFVFAPAGCTRSGLRLQPCNLPLSAPPRKPTHLVTVYERRIRYETPSCFGCFGLTDRGAFCAALPVVRC